MDLVKGVGAIEVKTKLREYQWVIEFGGNAVDRQILGDIRRGLALMNRFIGRKASTVCFNRGMDARPLDGV